MFANLAIRGAGFVISFIIARVVGVQGLGVYSAVVNTASTVAIPFSRVATNNSTISASLAFNQSTVVFRGYAKSYMLLMLALSVVSAVGFYFLFSSSISAESHADQSLLFLMITGTSVIIASLNGAVLQGFFNGAGNFTVPAKWYAITSIGISLAAFPVIYWMRLEGAFYLLILNSLLPLFVLNTKLLKLESPVKQFSQHEGARTHVIKQFTASSPTMVVATINAAVTWLCTIFLVQKYYGMVGVGLVAIATQWHTLVLMPASSWGNVIIKSLSDSMKTNSPSLITGTVFQLIRKNILATVLVGGLISLASGLITLLYGVSGNQLILLICINAIAAVIMSINNVQERLFLCLNQQPAWFWLSSTAFLIQGITTFTFMKTSILAVSIGMLSGALALSLLAWIYGRSLLRKIGRDSGF
ncbi:hypothetical protein LG201_00545 [Methylobacillus gramineus]|uniref:hypothetical protein n=1 Tax=Methylobacillus gramineus TaxID=755169 RepID=UPI001D000041|nr:hypothetical protein [Methylobacillus gramineus]MCB5183693.1 hypothetical protein [Methylobacillus gramineus]